MSAVFTDSILNLEGWAALALVFLLPALEASAFIGFLFPGEIAIILGGVLAYQGRLSLAAAIAAAILGAVIGDSVGYYIGRRWGRTMLRGTVGRLPYVRGRLDRDLDAAQEFVRRRRGSAVFFGRFTAALRVLVPGLAGMSGVHYPTFLAYNVAGGVVWGAGFVLLGYAAGAGYEHTEHLARDAGLAVLGAVVLGFVASSLIRRSKARSRARWLIREGRGAPAPPVDPVSADLPRAEVEPHAASARATAGDARTPGSHPPPTTTTSDAGPSLARGRPPRTPPSGPEA